MDRRYYRTGQFALEADVSIRTLRYYDKEGFRHLAAQRSGLPLIY